MLAIILFVIHPICAISEHFEEKRKEKRDAKWREENPGRLNTPWPD